MKQKKTTKLTALEKRQKEYNKLKKRVGKVVWDIYENGQQYHRGGINE